MGAEKRLCGGDATCAVSNECVEAYPRQANRFNQKLPCREYTDQSGAKG